MGNNNSSNNSQARQPQNNQQNQYQNPEQQYQQQQQRQQQQLEEQRQEQIKSQIYGNQGIQPRVANIQPQHNILGEEYADELFHMQSQAGIDVQKKKADINVQKTVAIKNDLIIDRDSFKLVESYNKNEPHIQFLTFKFDLETDANIGVYFAGTDELNPQTNCTLRITKKVPDYFNNNTFKFSVGKGQQYPTHIAPLDTKILSKELLTQKLNSSYYPLIIRIEKIDKSQEFKVLYVYGTFSYDNNFKLQIKIVKQKMELNGQAFIMNEVYGINESGVKTDDQKEFKECVICMTDPVDTIILPCKHMCLCIECCTSLRNKSEKCPMCRGIVESFMQLKKSEFANQQQQNKPEEQQKQQQQQQVQVKQSEIPQQQQQDKQQQQQQQQLWIPSEQLQQNQNLGQQQQGTEMQECRSSYQLYQPYHGVQHQNQENKDSYFYNNNNSNNNNNQ